MKEYLKDVSLVMDECSTGDEGLTKAEAEKRLAENGPNKLREAKKVSVIRRFLGELADPMIIILIIAAAISGVMAVIEGGEGFADVIIIMAVVLINAVLGVVQESKAEAAIAALQEIAAATSKVLRDGHVVTIKSEELVKGDVIVLEAGDSVPADARIIECASLKIEEAALTGESVPVTKQVETLELGNAADIPLGDRKNMMYMGSTVVYGRGKAVVVATGMDTEMGKIADALSTAEDEETPLQKKLNQLSKVLTVLVIAICVVIFGIQLLRASTINGTVVMDTFMVAVSLAVAAIPEGLAAVVTIVLAIGVTNMSKRKAVIRKLTAVETLGCTQIICSDKTGTLTQNKMTVVEVYAEDEALLTNAMSLCSDATQGEDGEAVGEPTECALVNAAAKAGLGKTEQSALFPRIGEAPFDSMRKMMSTVHKAPDGTIVQYTKGAPDEVLKKCTKAYIGGKMIPLTDAVKEAILGANKSMADQALRVLCAAMRVWKEAPASFEPEYLEADLCYIGLSGMIDPIRPEVKDAIVKCGEAGIRPIMITGDHRDTAVAIAKQLGILTDGAAAITGAELNELSDEYLSEHIGDYSVYARVQPEHKVRIVNAWKAKGKITAMTGDGVNDAPSIKSADIGVGMGITGTDVTKNVADMVLADDNFATIVSAVEEGRRIYDNIRKAIQYLLSSNLAEVFAIFVATLIGFTVLEAPHLLWINLVTDSIPALALGMEHAEGDVMRRKPRNAKDGMFAGGMGFDVVFQGVIVAALTLTSFFIGHYIQFGNWNIGNSEVGTTMAFLTLSMVEIIHSFNMRSRRKSVFSLKTHNKVLWGAMALSLVLTTLVAFVPFLQDAFGFYDGLTFAEYGIALAISFAILPIIEVTKFVQRKLGK
ncbi:MAG: cation-translocating P-type ATPase [Clostridia bacterium]|nr:cation-translocating P-type ATPase [Clostridia bacterium]